MNTSVQYSHVLHAFVLHCCDVMALCTASQISNKFCYSSWENQQFEDKLMTFKVQKFPKVKKVALGG